MIKKCDGYMDDLRAFLMSLKMGWRWHDGGLCYTESWRLEDEKAGESSTRRTGKILVESMNEILSFLKFTLEIGDDFKDGKLPSLDTTVWVKWQTCQEGALDDEVDIGQEQDQYQDDQTYQAKNSEEIEWDVAIQ